MSRQALGKGIRAIIPEETQEALAAEARPVPIDEIRPNPFQPRHHAEESLDELVESVKAKGVLQPVLLRRRRDGYELVTGERRWRAARAAGLTAIPAVVRSIEDGEMLELALIENLQRRNLNPVEEALGYKRMADEFKHTHDDIAKRVGKDRSTVTNALRLLNLPFKVRDVLAAGKITAGHARALLSLESRRRQVELCERIVKQDLSVRTVERLCQERTNDERRPTDDGRRTDPHVRELEESLQEFLGTRVRIQAQKQGRGQIVIEYLSADDLSRLVRKLRAPGRDPNLSSDSEPPPP
ncbi:ParB/RepB/Spo0J family partition protein, partial [candidate division WOR-3 bacterium]|nr:ParB/RepB/Spo0J family partition protein [candidate division WOR-3 bacterium]